MNQIHWRTIVSSTFVASALLLVLSASAWAQSGRDAPSAQVVVAQTTEPGVLIGRVTPNSPAAKAGLKRGDILLKVDDQAVNQADELAALIRAAQVGDRLTLTVQRGDGELELTLTIGERRGAPYLGIVPFRDLGLPGGDVQIWQAPFAAVGPNGSVSISQSVGVEIVRVVPEGPAATAGVVVGDLIVGVDGQSVTPEVDLSSLIQAHKPGDKVTLQVQGGEAAEEPKEITVTLGQHPDDEAQAYLGVQVMPRIFAQIERLQGAPQGRHFPPAPGMRRFRFMQPFDHAAPFMPMMPFGYWFGYPGYPMGWCQPSPEGMFFAHPLPPSTLEMAPEWFGSPGIEIDSFEVAPLPEPGHTPDGLVEPPLHWEETEPEI